MPFFATLIEIVLFSFLLKVSSINFLSFISELMIINFDVVYPFVGENLDYIKRLESDLKLNLNFLVRREDRFCIPLCNKGFFDFKKSIPKIIEIIT